MTEENKQPMVRLTREDILAAVDLPEEIVDVPEWGGSVLLKGLNVEQALEMLEKITDPKTDKVNVEKATLYAFLVGVIEPKFTEADLPVLKQKSMAAVKRITDAFTQLSGLNTTAVQEARKNS